MNPLSPLRYFGLVTVVILWISVGLSMLRTRLHLIDTRPLSFLGVDQRSHSLFSIGLICAAVSMLIFAVYLTQIYHLRRRFLVAVCIGQFGQIVAALAPYGHGGTKLLHTAAAFTLAFSVPLLMLLFMKNQTGAVRKTARKFMQFELLAFGVGISLFIFTEGAAPLSEIVTAVVFHCWLLWLTFRPNFTSVS